jgi:hypothetical protein
MDFDASAIADLQARLTVGWHEQAPAAAGEGLALLVAENHLRNFNLWHEEDLARRDDLGFEAVYRSKRKIDRFNQERTNFIEAMDQAFVAVLQPARSGCPLNSETPGMMVDRLSILALKEYHMREESSRADASGTHRENCSTKLARLSRQRAELTQCLAELMAEVAARRRSFPIFNQFKMYNDPNLNPQLYRPRA